MIIIYVFAFVAELKIQYTYILIMNIFNFEHIYYFLKAQERKFQLQNLPINCGTQNQEALIKDGNNIYTKLKIFIA